MSDGAASTELPTPPPPAPLVRLPARRPARHRAARRGDHPRASAATSCAGRSRPGRASADGRVVLRADDSSLGVVAQVPDIGALPDRGAGGDRARRDRGPASPPSTRPSAGRPTPTSRSSATLGRRRASRRSAASCASCSSRSPSCAARAGCPSCCARRRNRARWPTGSSRGPTSTRTAGARCWPRSPCADRVELVLAWAREHLAELQVAESIRNDVTEGVDRQQREYLLRQQLAAIRKELGEDDDDVVGEYRTRLESLDAAGVGPNFIAKEIDRLERTSAQSPEQGWIRTWLDRVFELPWGVRSDDTIDLAAAQRDPRRGPLRPRRRQVAHRRVPRRAQAARRAPASTRTRAGAGPRAARAGTAPSSRSSARPASARPASASRSPGRWAASSSASPSAASATRRRSAATAARTSGRSPAAS